jgi:hypothetical protein
MPRNVYRPTPFASYKNKLLLCTAISIVFLDDRSLFSAAGCNQFALVLVIVAVVAAHWTATSGHGTVATTHNGTLASRRLNTVLGPDDAPRMVSTRHSRTRIDWRSGSRRSRSARLPLRTSRRRGSDFCKEKTKRTKVY